MKLDHWGGFEEETDDFAFCDIVLLMFVLNNLLFQIFFFLFVCFFLLLSIRGVVP